MAGTNAFPVISSCCSSAGKRNLLLSDENGLIPETGREQGGHVRTLRRSVNQLRLQVGPLSNARPASRNTAWSLRAGQSKTFADGHSAARTLRNHGDQRCLQGRYQREIAKFGSRRSHQFVNRRESPLSSAATISSALPTRRQVRASCIAAASVVLTREAGKNGKLLTALTARGLQCLELPLIEHRQGPDVHKLSSTIRDQEFEWIVVTSPEAATVFMEGWRDADSPEVRIAVVGMGTAQEFDKVKEGRDILKVEFSPSKATAKTLSAELPKLANGNGHVLYPSSAKAGNDLESGLSGRGFVVTRLNTYSTESVKVVDQEKVAAAMTAPVATFASPTAVKAWVELMGSWSGAAACIGVTSAEAAKKAGMKEVFYPDKPGIEGWVDSIIEAVHSQQVQNSIIAKT